MSEAKTAIDSIPIFTNKSRAFRHHRCRSWMSSFRTNRALNLFSAMTLLAAMVMSVQFQASATPIRSDTYEAPCLNHHIDSAPDPIEPGCASHCVSESLKHLVDAPIIRVSPPDLTATIFTSPDVVNHFSGPIQITQPVLGHDPPGSTLYLTTKRLRI